MQVDPLAVGRGEGERIECRQAAILQDPLAGAEVPPNVGVVQLLRGKYGGRGDHGGYKQSVEPTTEIMAKVDGSRLIGRPHPLLVLVTEVLQALLGCAAHCTRRPAH